MCPWKKQEINDIGKSFPQEYIEMLSDQLQFTLYDWLKVQGAPPELLEALSCAAVLHQYSAWMKHGELSDACAGEIPAAVADVARFIKMFGGKFTDGGTSEICFPVQVEWEGFNRYPE